MHRAAVACTRSEEAVSGRQHACVCRGEGALTSVKTALDAALFHALIILWCYGSKGDIPAICLESHELNQSISV